MWQSMHFCVYLNKVFVLFPQKKNLTLNWIISVFNNSTFGYVRKWHKRTIHSQSGKHIIKWLITFQTTHFVILRTCLSPWISDSPDRLNLSPHAPGYHRQKEFHDRSMVTMEDAYNSTFSFIFYMNNWYNCLRKHKLNVMECQIDIHYKGKWVSTKIKSSNNLFLRFSI